MAPAATPFKDRDDQIIDWIDLAGTANTTPNNLRRVQVDLNKHFTSVAVTSTTAALSPTSSSSEDDQQPDIHALLTLALAAPATQPSILPTIHEEEEEGKELPSPPNTAFADTSNAVAPKADAPKADAPSNHSVAEYPVLNVDDAHIWITDGENWFYLVNIDPAWTPFGEHKASATPPKKKRTPDREIEVSNIVTCKRARKQRSL